MLRLRRWWPTSTSRWSVIHFTRLSSSSLVSFHSHLPHSVLCSFRAKAPNCRKTWKPTWQQWKVRRTVCLLYCNMLIWFITVIMQETPLDGSTDCISAWLLFLLAQWLLNNRDESSCVFVFQRCTMRRGGCRTVWLTCTNPNGLAKRRWTPWQRWVCIKHCSSYCNCLCFHLSYSQLEMSRVHSLLLIRNKSYVTVANCT